MSRFLPSLGIPVLRIAVTLAVVAVAAVIGWQFWAYYMDEPWTRDGRVRADVVGVTPDVSGLVSDVPVRDNQQVKAGDVLFHIDRARFLLALQQSEAAVASRRAALDEAIRERDRYSSLSSAAVSQEKQQQTDAAAKAAQAAYQQSLADRDLAKLNLERTEVRAPVNGTITNFDLRPGDYVTAGKPVTALVDSDTLRVEGYFEETKLPRIHEGDRVVIHLMGDDTPLQGHVESIAAGIEDRDRSSSSSLLANVNPTFSWVRLAQRVPVRIALDSTADARPLVVGRTATVAVHSPDAGQARRQMLQAVRRWPAEHGLMKWIGPVAERVSALFG